MSAKAQYHSIKKSELYHFITHNYMLWDFIALERIKKEKDPGQARVSFVFFLHVEWEFYGMSLSQKKHFPVAGFLTQKRVKSGLGFSTV